MCAIDCCYLDRSNADFACICRRAQDGTDAIYIPFPNETLAAVLADMEVAE